MQKYERCYDVINIARGLVVLNVLLGHSFPEARIRYRETDYKVFAGERYMSEDNNLFYTCSLIEFLGRETKNRRDDMVRFLGEDLKRIYSHADVFHCEPIEKGGG